MQNLQQRKTGELQTNALKILKKKMQILKTLFEMTLVDHEYCALEDIYKTNLQIQGFYVDDSLCYKDNFTHHYLMNIAKFVWKISTYDRISYYCIFSVSEILHVIHFCMM